MKYFGLLILFALSVATAHAQYDKEKLIKILTANAWSAKAVNKERPEKKFVFNKDMSVQIERDNGKGAITPQKDKWSVTSTDNIRWFLSVGATKYELIISYTKSGSQYVKLVSQGGTEGVYEINLTAIK